MRSYECTISFVDYYDEEAKLKLAVTTVGRRGPDEDEGCNMERFRAAELALAKAADLGADLIVLPGGFFTAHSSRARDTIANSLISKAKEIGIAIIFGIDQDSKDLSKDWVPAIRNGALPFYVFAWSPSENAIHFWRQRSITSEDQRWAPDSSCKEARLLRIADREVGILICGEIFNQRIRNSLANRSPRPKVIVDVAHVGGGFRVWQGMKKLAKLGLASVCSVHVQREYAVKYCYDPKMGCLSTRIRDDYVFGPLRIELKLWTF